jgi:hypothetical protein
MAQITFNNKNTGDQFSASEVNQIKSVVNTNDSRLTVTESDITDLDSRVSIVENSGGGGAGFTNWSEDTSGHIIPASNATYDIGSAEKKVRHLYLSNNSLYFGDSPTQNVPFNADMVLRSVRISDEFGVAPPDANEPGVRGDLRIAGGYMYLCVVNNTWVRAPIELDWTL